MLKGLSLLIASACLAIACPAAEQTDDETYDPEALMKALPVVDIPAPRAVEAWPESDLLTFAEGLRVFRQERLVLPGTVLFDSGPTDGLEVIACLKGGKNHESMIVLDTANGTALKAACLAWLKVEQDGMGVDEESGDLPRGLPLRIALRYCPDPLLDPDKIVEADISTLVRNRLTDRPYPPLPYIYTGSRIERIPVGEEQKMANRFMLEVTKSVVVNFNEPDALIAAAYPMSVWDQVFEVNTGNKPPFKQVPVELTIERAELPLELTMAADGALSFDGQVLDDAALGALLQATYGEPAPELMRAVAVRVERGFDRDLDRAVMTRVTRLAAAAGCWVIPVFVL